MSDKASSADNQQGRLNEKFTLDYVVGLVDGEGYFSVSAYVDRSQGWNSHNVKMVFFESSIFGTTFAFLVPSETTRRPPI